MKSKFNYQVLPDGLAHNAYKLKNFKKEQSNYALTKKQLNKLYSLDLNHNKHFKKVRDIFCFMAHTSLRHSDIYIIDGNSRMGKELQIIIVKKNMNLNIPLSREAIQIFERYEGKFPKRSNQEMNVRLKELAKLIGVSLISTHMARNTSFELMHEKGMRTTDIMKIMGHKPICSF